MYNEINRVIRPGGYLWMRGGWSAVQIKALKWLLETKFGYVPLYDKQTAKPADITAKVSFGPELPYEFDWSVIWVKPISAAKKSDCSSEPAMPFKAPATPEITTGKDTK